MDPVTLTLFLLAGGGLWLLTIELRLARHQAALGRVDAAQHRLDQALADLRTDLKLEAVRTRQDLVETVRGEIAYALGARPAAQTQWNLGDVQAGRDTSVGSTYNPQS